MEYLIVSYDKQYLISLGAQERRSSRATGSEYLKELEGKCAEKCQTSGLQVFHKQVQRNLC